MKYVFIIIGLGFVTSISLFFYIGFGPRPLRLINPTVYENHKQIGVSAYYRIRQKLEHIKTIVVDDLTKVPHHDMVWKGFEAALISDNLKKIEIIRLSQLPPAQTIKKNSSQAFIKLQPYVVNQEQMELLQKTCLLSADYYHPHKCVAVKVSQNFFRKKLPADKLSGVLQAFGLGDYHLFVYDPVMWQ